MLGTEIISDSKLHKPYPQFLKPGCSTSETFSEAFKTCCSTSQTIYESFKTCIATAQTFPEFLKAALQLHKPSMKILKSVLQLHKQALNELPQHHLHERLYHPEDRSDMLTSSETLIVNVVRRRSQGRQPPCERLADGVPVHQRGLHGNVDIASIGPFAALFVWRVVPT
ncbi:hypothetical protein CEXT_308561 [Caerostris extrusa]|uniref:Uncharacterized protein n=1 Tax=Caerostris extrusa TaxID=172846 RepID=A0AAV4PWN4_CAEEX|nr:hypothetical protein CEXT_308561 [Caerostris extrusa]